MSGKKVKAKRKAKSREVVANKMAQVAAGAPATLELHTPAPTLKLDLACGQTPREGFEGVDLWAPDAKHKVNLLRYPWPWADSSVAEIYCSHFAEHIPMEYVDEFGNVSDIANGKDALFRFFEEIHRVLIPDGWATIIVPNARSNRGFQDPTHRRFFVAETFLYFMLDWRKQNKLDHYNTTANFGGNLPDSNGVLQPDIVPIIPIEANVWSAEVQQKRFTHEWNTIWDWQAKIRAIK